MEFDYSVIVLLHPTGLALGWRQTAFH